MKTCIVFLFFTVAVSAQSMQPIVSGSPIFFGKTNIFNSSLYTLTTESAANQTAFVSYNNMMGYYDQLNASGSKITSVTYLDNFYQGVRVDSFNPNGATDLKGGLVAGALNLIFNGNSGRSFFIR